MNLQQFFSKQGYDISEKLNHAGSDVTKLYVKTDKKKLRELQDSVGI